MMKQMGLPVSFMEAKKDKEKVSKVGLLVGVFLLFIRRDHSFGIIVVQILKRKKP